MSSVWIFASLLTTMVPVLAEIEIQFIKWPEPVTAVIGTTRSFECAVQVPAAKFVWRTFERIQDFKNWTVLDATDGNSTMSRLLVTITEDMPNSWYQCAVGYGAVTLASVPARLTVARINLNTNRIEKRVLTAPVKNDLLLHCKPPQSDPPAILTWWKEDGGKKTPINTTHGVLELQNLSLQDTGAYGCTATNELSGQVEDLPERTYLQVQRGGFTQPSFLESEEYTGTKSKDGVLTKVLYPGEPLRLWCGVIGRPQPHVVWTRGNLRHYLHNSMKDQLLIIDPFEAQHEDIYSCTADNISRSWKVIRYQEPTWDGAARGVNASEGHPARVSCGRPRGYPKPTVYWLLNSKPLVPGRGVTMNDFELNLERVEKRHAGVVQCMACSERTCAYDAALLTVEPAQISNPNYSEDFSKIDQHQPTPKRHSRKNSKKQVLKLVPPSRPNVTRMSDNSVMVTWSGPDEGLPVTFYKVQYRELTDNNTNWNTENQYIDRNIHSYLIEGIEPDKYYRFRIAAVYSNNDNKQGKISAKFYLHRGEFHKPSTPILTDAVSYAPTEIMLNWTWSSENGLKHEGFYVYYRVLSTAGEYNKVWAAPTARALRLSYLQPDTAYEIKLQAYCEQGPSDFSAILKGKTMRIPSMTPEVVPTPRTEGAEVPRRGGALVPAAGAIGAALLLAAGVGTIIICRRARRPPLKEKNSRADSNAANGYIPAKVPITITANPMHNEAGDSSVEMSYMHNNNCGNSTVEDNTALNRKNTNTRNYV